MSVLIYTIIYPFFDFFFIHLSFCLYHVPCPWKISFNTSCTTGLLMMNSLRFCFLNKSLFFFNFGQIISLYIIIYWCLLLFLYWLLSRYSLCLWFSTAWVWFLGTVVGIHLLGVLWASWISCLMSVINFRMISAIITLNIFSSLFYFFLILLVF